MPGKRARNTNKPRGKHAAHAAPPAPKRASAPAPNTPRPAQTPHAPQKPRPAVPHVPTANQAVHPGASASPTAKVPHTPAARPQGGQIPVSREMPSAHPQAQKTSKAKKAKRAKKKRVPRAFKIVITIILVVVLAGGGFLVWDYLFRYDDKQDFQGQWKIEGTNASIVITDSEIKLTDSVSFGYELDTFAKTIKYTYVNYANEGSYVFSPERDVLTITDVDPEANQGEGNQSMRLLKVSNQSTGEPETANNNDTSDAQTNGVGVIDGTESPTQAERNEQAAGSAQGGD